MARLLVMMQRDVVAAERDVYLRELDARRHTARAQGANFWVFEQSDHDGRFLEFMEAGSEAALHGAHGGASPTQPLWREVEGG